MTVYVVILLWPWLRFILLGSWGTCPAIYRCWLMVDKPDVVLFNWRSFIFNSARHLTCNDERWCLIIFFLSDRLHLLMIHLPNKWKVMSVLDMHVLILINCCGLLKLFGVCMLTLVHAVGNSQLVNFCLGRWLCNLSVTVYLWIHYSNLFWVITLTLWLLTACIGCCIRSSHKIILCVYKRCFVVV